MISFTNCRSTFVIKLGNFRESLTAVPRFELLLRDISLRTFFLNGVRFDLRESVNVSFPNTCVNGRFVKRRWLQSL